MSHNSKYYAKRPRKKDAKGTPTLNSLWNKASNVPESSLPVETRPSTSSVSETPVPVTVECSEQSPSITTVGETSVPVTVSCSEPINTDTVSCYNSPSPKPDLDTSNSEDEEPSAKVLAVDRRRFDGSKYENAHKWLYYSVAKGGYMCKYCELFPFISKDKLSKWGETGVSLGTHPSRKINKHCKSEHHEFSCKKYVEAHTKHTESSKKLKVSVHQQIVDSVATKEKQDILKNREVLKKLFRIVYFIVQKYWAQTNFEDVTKFVASLGVEDLSAHIRDAPDYATYLSDNTASELINMIGQKIQNDLLASLRNSSMFALLADESTDEKNREQLSIFIKWPTKSSTTEDHFMGLVNVKRANAETLLNAIQDFCTENGIDIRKCMFVAFDGANVMSGEVSGLQRRIRHLSPFCLYINCRNHRLALCLKHLMKTYPMLVEVDSVLLAIWKLFKFSPSRFEVFKSVQEAYGEVQVTLVQAATTRWLSHGDACVRFIERFNSILDTLDQLYDQKREPEVYGLRANITNKNFISMVLLLCDVLRPVNILSLSLQDSSINFTDVDEKVKACIDELTSIIPGLQSVPIQEDLQFSKVEAMHAEIDDRTALQRRLRNDGHLQPGEFITTVGAPFIHSLVGEITDAFVSNPVLKAFRALDSRRLPQTLEELPDHAKEDIQVLANHYCTEKEDTFKGHISRAPPVIDSIPLLKFEFSGFKNQMLMYRESGQARNPAELYATMHSTPHLQIGFPRIHHLLQLLTIIPSSTAAVERGFSTMNLLCTSLRTSLGQEKLSNLMRICIEGPVELSEQTLEELCNTFRDTKARQMKL